MAKYRCGDHWCTDEELEQLEKVREGMLKIVDPEEKDTETLVRKVLSDEKKAEEKAKREESERSGITVAIKGIGDRLDKMDADFCSRFPELCAKVDHLEEAIPKKLEKGSEEWRETARKDYMHDFFCEEPDCKAIRDEVLSAKGKRLADVEAEAEVEEEVEERTEQRTSPGYFSGSKWDGEKELYVEQG